MDRPKVTDYLALVSPILQDVYIHQLILPSGWFHAHWKAQSSHFLGPTYSSSPGAHLTSSSDSTAYKNRNRLFRVSIVDAAEERHVRKHDTCRSLLMTEILVRLLVRNEMMGEIREERRMLLREELCSVIREELQSALVAHDKRQGAAVL